ncbi:MAG: ComF family protein, partial [Thermoguttaceae bacterium]
WFGRFLNLLYPAFCANCKSELPETDTVSVLLCTHCRNTFASKEVRFCQGCGSFFPVLYDVDIEKSVVSNNSYCKYCVDEKNAFNRVIPLGEYKDELRETVLKMKNDKSGVLADSVAQLLVNERRRELEHFGANIVIPVPMYFWKSFERGVNSSEVAAQRIGQMLNLPIYNNIAYRNRATRPQSELSPNQRISNVKKVFSVRKKFWLRYRYVDARRFLEGKNILIVDDILTTGATSNELAKALRQFGAKSIAVAVIARAIGNKYFVF